MHLYPVNGAAHDVAPGATAWGHRDAKYAWVIAGMWPDPADNEANIAWVKDYYAALTPYSLAGGYVNFASADDQARVRDNFGTGYDRLRAGQAAVRPGQRVPPQPEHRPCLTLPARLAIGASRQSPLTAGRPRRIRPRQPRCGWLSAPRLPPARLPPSRLPVSSGLSGSTAVRTNSADL